MSEVIDYRTELHKIADVLETHWKGAGLPLKADWMLKIILDLCHEKDVLDDQNDNLTRERDEARAEVGLMKAERDFAFTEADYWKREVERLRRALEQVAAPTYGLQGIIEDYPDPNAYNYHAMKYWSQLAACQQARARNALTPPQSAPVSPETTSEISTGPESEKAATEVPVGSADYAGAFRRLTTEAMPRPEAEVAADFAIVAEWCRLQEAKRPVHFRTPGFPERTTLDTEAIYNPLDGYYQKYWGIKR